MSNYENEATQEQVESEDYEKDYAITIVGYESTMDSIDVYRDKMSYERAKAMLRCYIRGEILDADMYEKTSMEVVADMTEILAEAIKDAMIINGDIGVRKYGRKRKRRRT